MPRHQRQLRLGQLAVHDVQVRAAYAAGGDLEQQLALGGLRVRKLGAAQRASRSVEHHRAHGSYHRSRERPARGRGLAERAPGRPRPRGGGLPLANGRAWRGRAGVSGRPRARGVVPGRGPRPVRAAWPPRPPPARGGGLPGRRAPGGISVASEWWRTARARRGCGGYSATSATLRPRCSTTAGRDRSPPARGDLAGRLHGAAAHGRRGERARARRLRAPRRPRAGALPRRGRADRPGGRPHPGRAERSLRGARSGRPLPASGGAAEAASRGRVRGLLRLGVTACVLLLAAEAAGAGPGRLYPGSWSEWCALQQDAGSASRHRS